MKNTKEDYEYYLLGVKGDVWTAVRDFFAVDPQKFYEGFISRMEEEERINFTPEAIAGYMVKNSEAFPDDPLTDETVTQVEDSETQEMVIGTCNELRANGLTLYKVKIQWSNSLRDDIEELFDELDAGDMGNCDFYFGLLFGSRFGC